MFRRQLSKKYFREQKSTCLIFVSICLVNCLYTIKVNAQVDTTVGSTVSSNVAAPAATKVPARATAADASGGNDEAELYFNRQEDELSKEPTLQDIPKKQDIKNSKSTEIKELADLGTLAPFKDIAVIQKRFLPKTGRFEVFTAVGSSLNDAFFVDGAANLRLGYYFKEKLGIEFTGMYISSMQRKVTNDLEARGVTTTSLVSPKNYYGLDVKYSPIYGKMASFNEKLVSFDMYFSAGLGQTGTDNGSEPSLHVGSGQIFAMSKSWALRWDFSWNFYQATSYSDAAKTASSRSVYNNLFILLGASFFFPEATYR